MARSTSALSAGVGLAAIVFFAANLAHATAFTIQSNIDINQNGLIARIRPVTDDTGAFSVTTGVVNFAVQDYVMFDVRLLLGSTRGIEGVMAAVNTTLGGLDIVGAGAFADAPVPKQEPGGVSIIPPNADFDFSGANLISTLGEISARLFLTFPDAGALGNLAEGQTIDFTIDPTGTGPGGNPFVTSGVLVPEPGTLALLAGSLVALSARRWRRTAA